jgi:hypothetical protein
MSTKPDYQDFEAVKGLPRDGSFEPGSLHRGVCEPTVREAGHAVDLEAKPSTWGRTSACECISSRALRAAFPAPRAFPKPAPSIHLWK